MMQCRKLFTTLVLWPHAQSQWCQRRHFRRVDIIPVNFLVFYGASRFGSLRVLLIRCDSCHQYTSYICVFHRLWVMWARASEAINPMKGWGVERRYDNSERPAVIMVFMKRWNSVQTKSVAPGKINSLALRRDPCLSWGYSKHTKTLLLFFISQEWGNEVHRLLVIIN